LASRRIIRSLSDKEVSLQSHFGKRFIAGVVPIKKTSDFTARVRAPSSDSNYFLILRDSGALSVSNFNSLQGSGRLKPRTCRLRAMGCRLKAGERRFKAVTCRLKA